MQRTKIIATEVAMPTTAGAASSISEATCVRLYNGSGAAATVSISTSVGAATTSTFTMATGSVEFLEKHSTDVIFASSASVLAAKVGLTN
ncbi:MAG: hypothetical protein ACO24P_03760 [Candidatus Nanopelagicaceae bacterium]